MSACAFSFSFTSRLLRWLVVASSFVTLPPPCVAPPFPVHSTHGSIAVAPFASPSRRPLPLRCVSVVPSIAPIAIDCCRFHCHRRVNVHPPLLPLRLLCCACHCRPSPSRHPSPPSRHPLPPLLVDCCIFHVHCRIAVHYRCSIAPTIAVDAVAVALPLRCPCPSPPMLVDCCLAVGSHCNRRADHRCHSTDGRHGHILCLG